MNDIGYFLLEMPSYYVRYVQNLVYYLKSSTALCKDAGFSMLKIMLTQFFNDVKVELLEFWQTIVYLEF